MTIAFLQSLNAFCWKCFSKYDSTKKYLLLTLMALLEPSPVKKHLLFLSRLLWIHFSAVLITWLKLFTWCYSHNILWYLPAVFPYCLICFMKRINCITNVERLCDTLCIAQPVLPVVTCQLSTTPSEVMILILLMILCLGLSFGSWI